MKFEFLPHLRAMQMPTTKRRILEKNCSLDLLFSLSGECLLKKSNFVTKANHKNIDLAPKEQTNKLMTNNLNSEGTDE